MKKIAATIILAAIALRVAAASTLTPTHLLCDYAVNPLGVDAPPPRLFWQVKSPEPNQAQTAYQILVASSLTKLAKDEGNLWNSGKVNSDKTLQINYAGKPLHSWQQVFWKVRVWDAKDQVSAWSQPARWTMGVLKSSDWHAHWIGAANTKIPSLLLRHVFQIKPGLRRALVNVCGLGEYEMTLNGKKVGHDFLTPGWTEYNKTCLYNTYDITSLLRPGKNAVGLELGNGMYQVLRDGRFTKFKRSFGPQKAIAQIRLEYADGTVVYVGTDSSWRVAPSPITFTSIYGGEGCDARLDQPGWNLPGFDAAHWQQAVLMSGPGGKLRGLSCQAPPIREFQTQPALSSLTLTNGDTVYDLGQNAAHVLKVSVTGPAGSEVLMYPSELTNKDGSVNQHSMGAGHRGYIWCNYTKRTNGKETWSPKFFYVGCRYVQVHCQPATPNGPLPKVTAMSGIVVHSACPVVGRFKCSNELFNRIFTLVHWAQQNNMMSIMTDCPHRERLGWLEQDHLNGPALRYDFRLARLFTKTLNDIADSQLSDGLVPTTAPEYAIFGNKHNLQHPRNNFGDSPAWSSSFIIIPWQQYKFDGDLHLFRLHYQAMTRYLDYLGSRATNYIVNYGLGDWYDLGPKKPGFCQLTPVALTGTAFYFDDAQIMSRAARLLGKTRDAERYATLAKHIRAAFNAKFYHPDKHCYATDSQCANAIPLAMGLCEPANRDGVLNSIVQDIRARGNGLTAGDVGYRYLLRALADNGRNDVFYEMNNQTTKPGYGLEIAKGKTSLTESWDGGGSQDHFMLGQIQEWFYHDLAGIQDDQHSPGFKRIVIAPHPVGDITWTKASYQSIRGTIVSDWQINDGRFTLNTTIPANTTATVLLPAKSAKDLRVNPKAKFVRMKNECAVYQIGSGNYRFTSRWGDQ